MAVISVSLSQDELAEFDRLVEHFNYASRSEAIRDALYAFVASHRLEFEGAKDLVFTLIYDAHKRKEEVHDVIHAQGEHVRTSLHNHMGDRCVDVIVAHGPGEKMHELVHTLTRLRDVRVNVTPL